MTRRPLDVSEVFFFFRNLFSREHELGKIGQSSVLAPHFRTLWLYMLFIPQRLGYTINAAFLFDFYILAEAFLIGKRMVLVPIVLSIMKKDKISTKMTISRLEFFASSDGLL